jgi:fibrillarin-like rRNA methylase
MELASEIVGKTFANMKARSISVAGSALTCYSTVADKLKATTFETQLEKASNIMLVECRLFSW